MHGVGNCFGTPTQPCMPYNLSIMRTYSTLPQPVDHSASNIKELLANYYIPTYPTSASGGWWLYRFKRCGLRIGWGSWGRANRAWARKMRWHWYQAASRIGNQRRLHGIFWGWVFWGGRTLLFIWHGNPWDCMPIIKAYGYQNSHLRWSLGFETA